MLAEYGREAYDLKIIECSIEDFKTSQHFDAVTMFHVIEHVPEPVKALEHIRSFMSNNGVLLLIVPNTKSLGARLFKEKYDWNAPHHVSFFSPKSIVSVLSKTGFEVLSVDHLLSPPLLLYSFNNWSRFKIFHPFVGNAIFTPIAIIGKLLSMGEVIAVYARAT